MPILCYSLLLFGFVLAEHENVCPKIKKNKGAWVGLHICVFAQMHVSTSKIVRNAENSGRLLGKAQL